MNRRRQILKYVLLDFVTAILAWALLNGLLVE